MNNIADIISGKPIFDIPKVNEAEHFVNYVVSNLYLKLHEISWNFMKFERQPKTIRFSLKFLMQWIIIDLGSIKTIFVWNPTKFYERNLFFMML